MQGLEGQNIRQQFTAGVLSTIIRERLLLDSNIPFEQVIEIIRNIEQTKIEAKELTMALETNCPATSLTPQKRSIAVDNLHVEFHLPFSHRGRIFPIGMINGRVYRST
ncbi:hypothetical protein HPB47_024676 [Ixodes persulcatus]|uniref:Uncharacterized protein n=1 Tax=Ixodes persulcatus TaxID=34615 RepID=A0AC60Q477_IXOPE|nr:hypothetical protein HPB47_024676 [Ixodes persulcatus]